MTIGTFSIVRSKRDDGLPELKAEDTVVWLRMFFEEELRPKMLATEAGPALPEHPSGISDTIRMVFSGKDHIVVRFVF